MNSSELKKRIVDEFSRNGFTMINVAGIYHSEHKNKTGERFFLVEEVHRHNGTAENVTATIMVLEVDTVWSEHSCSLKAIEKIKVPKNASDKVISNRVNKAMEAFNTK